MSRVFHQGPTTVIVRPRSVVVQHHGSMGDTVKTVRENVDRLFDPGMFDNLLESATKEVGYPCGEYVLRSRHRISLPPRYTFTYISRSAPTLKFYVEADNREHADSRIRSRIYRLQESNRDVGLEIPRFEDFDCIERVD